ERNSLYRTVQEAFGRREIKESRSKTSNAWTGRKVLLGADVELDERRKSVFGASITRNGGKIVYGGKNWEDASQDLEDQTCITSVLSWKDSLNGGLGPHPMNSQESRNRNTLIPAGS
ncbi:hypothetical protein FRC02_007082, partial [Tulasnella sp. 418]